MQVGIPLTDEEAALVRSLTPQERAQRLLIPAPAPEDDGLERRQQIFRVALADETYRDLILALDTDTRRARLLAGGAER